MARTENNDGRADWNDMAGKVWKTTPDENQFPLYVQGELNSTGVQTELIRRKEGEYDPVLKAFIYVDNIVEE